MCVLSGLGQHSVDGSIQPIRPYGVKPDQVSGKDRGGDAERDESAVIALDVEGWMHGFCGGLGPRGVIAEK